MSSHADSCVQVLNRAGHRRTATDTTTPPSPQLRTCLQALGYVASSPIKQATGPLAYALIQSRIRYVAVHAAGRWGRP
jgi:hypothetical protein